jgi:hypothetical protein
MILTYTAQRDLYRLVKNGCGGSEVSGFDSDDLRGYAGGVLSPKELCRMSTNLKAVTIVATFPELNEGARDQQGTGIGTSMAVATTRALKNLLKQPGLKHRQYTTFNAIISVATTTSSEGFSIYKPEYWMMRPPQIAWQPIPKKSRTLLFRRGRWLPVDRA